MNTYIIGCRWSNDGNSNSVIDIFRRYNIVFAGEKQAEINETIKANDLIAIKDGKTVVAIAKSLNTPMPITEQGIIFREQDKQRFGHNNQSTISIKAKIIDIPKNDQFQYNKRGTFYPANKHKDIIIRLYEKYSRGKQFSINAKTYILKHNKSNNYDVLLNNQTTFSIPIFQRAYAWSEDQISKFITDIFHSFWGVNKDQEPEPMFIGTMQLSEPIYLTKNKSIQNVIDGQQRLTTLLIFLKVLSLRYGTCQELQSITFDWLESEVDNGRQQDLLDEYLLGDSSLDSNNIYTRNASLVSSFLDNNLKNDEEKEVIFNIDEFIQYIFSKIYFVIIETCAGLSKTLQIFDAINTTGLDLNAGDVFKIRLFEYLTEVKGYDKNTAFIEITKKLYERLIVENNKLINCPENDIKTPVCDIYGILNIYQYILIAKYKLPNILCFYNPGTFFERLFDTLLNVNQWDNFKNLGELELKLDDIETVIKARYDWEELPEKDNPLIQFIYWSRYGRYSIFIFIFLFRFKDDKNLHEKLSMFIQQLSKLLILYSVYFDKAIGAINSFLYSLLLEMFMSEVESYDLIQSINAKINDLVPYHEKEPRKVMEEKLRDNIFYNHKKKNLLCRLSAMLEEINNSFQIDNKLISQQLFFSKIDIEHIQSLNDHDIKIRDVIKQQWGSELHTIGNLMILESNINQSIKNKPYIDKIVSYEKSKYKIVKNMPTTYKQWDQKDCQKRKTSEIDKIMNYLFDC